MLTAAVDKGKTQMDIGVSACTCNNYVVTVAVDELWQQGWMQGLFAVLSLKMFAIFAFISSTVTLEHVFQLCSDLCSVTDIMCLDGMSPLSRRWTTYIWMVSLVELWQFCFLTHSHHHFFPSGASSTTTNIQSRLWLGFRCSAWRINKNVRKWWVAWYITDGMSSTQ